MSRLIDISEKSLIRKVIRHPIALEALLRKLNLPLSPKLRIALNLSSDMLIEGWKGTPGDVDLIFEYSCGRKGWLIGIEAKFLRFPTEPSDAQSLPLHKIGLDQALGLKRMGFHLIWLVYFASKPPVEGAEGWDWVRASYFDFEKLYKRILGLKWRGERRLGDVVREEGIGVLVMGWGEVEPKMAEGSGGISPLLVINSIFNFSEASGKLRNSFDRIFEEGLRNSPSHLAPPPVLLMCERCKGLFVTNSWEIPDNCPLCGKYLG
ncbi:hypothetical protein DRP77_10985 [Candidatus Poribacteria bacterium]|nr:MAG: hypothetical protein DRP77_10985 [Candidatus Poribacteria bacterium]